MDKPQLVRSLADYPFRLFGSLAENDLVRFLSVLTPCNHPANTVILEEGKPGNAFYLVLAGRIEVLKAFGTPDEHRLNILSAGDCFGEMSLFDPDGLRTATVRTLTAAEMLEMSRSAFDDLLHRFPSVACEIARVLSVRLRDANNATIQDLQEKNRQLTRALADLQAAQEQLIAKEKLEHELYLAREIQQSFLPGRLPLSRSFDFGACIQPAMAVGGDFFDFIPIDQEHMGIAVGDVSGKGIPAALFMAMTQSLIRVEAGRGLSPVSVLEQVNRHLMNMGDSSMFVTALYGVLDMRGNRFSYARAGHPLPVVCHEDGTLSTPSHSEGQPLGIFADLSLDRQTLLLSRGSTFIIYTDGITEAANSRGDLYGTERLRQRLSLLRNGSAQEICDALLKDAMDFQVPNPPSDDVTLVTVRARAS
jgi:serine phosphatase RsbU (regulator of sigma subunit)